MKKITLALLLTNVTFGQELPQLTLTQNGVEPIVVDVKEKTAQELYQKALNWVQETYKNPDEVLKANITNEKIRFNGYKQHAWSWKTMGMKQTVDMEYTIEVSFKDTQSSPSLNHLPRGLE